MAGAQTPGCLKPWVGGLRLVSRDIVHAGEGRVVSRLLKIVSDLKGYMSGGVSHTFLPRVRSIFLNAKGRKCNYEEL